jgi:hypothetical protein
VSSLTECCGPSLPRRRSAIRAAVARALHQNGGSGPICAPPSSLEAVLGLVKYPCGESQTADRADLLSREEIRLIERTNPEKGTPNFQHPRPRPAMSGLRRLLPLLGRAQGVEKGQFEFDRARRVAAQNNRATETRSPIGQARRQAALFCRRSRLARTRITLSAKNGVCLTMKRNCCS